MKPTKVSGWKGRSYVQERKPFTNHNKQLYAEWVSPHIYVVYSYGPHWPLYIYCADTNCWYANEDKVSRTTSRHSSQTHPLVDTHPRSCTWMKQAVDRGTAFILLSHCDEAA